MDLYYLLNVFPIHIPPLRNRQEDIPVLAEHFIRTFSKKYNRPVTKIADHLIKELVSHHWPGNIRELEHLIERSVLLCDSEKITHLPDFRTDTTFIKGAPWPSQPIKTMEETERDYILQVLEKCNGKIFGKGGAAEMLDMNVSTLNSRIRKLGIEKKAKFSKNDS